MFRTKIITKLFNLKRTLSNLPENERCAFLLANDDIYPILESANFFYDKSVGVRKLLKEIQKLPGLSNFDVFGSRSVEDLSTMMTPY